VLVAVLIKQIPRFEEMSLGQDGRLRRDGTEQELNPYCRRAVAKAVELVTAYGGECVAFCLGPPRADDALREAIACGATRGVHICDPSFAGSDTLATSRALAGAIRQEGTFDVVLAGRNSVDSDTGQVGPEVAEILGLPMLAGVRELSFEGGTWLRARCESDDGGVLAQTTLPALITTAERLCAPAKAPRPQRDAVDPALIKLVDARALGAGPWGQAGSPTTVGELRIHQHRRQMIVLRGSLASQVDDAVRVLRQHGLLDSSTVDVQSLGAVPPPGSRGCQREILVLLEHGREAVARELLGTAADVAVQANASVVAVDPGPTATAALRSWGADQIVRLTGSHIEQDIAHGLAQWCREHDPWAILAPATVPGREISARIAAALGLGLTGDAIDLTLEEDRLVGWKPAFGGQSVAAIRTSSDTQMLTVRPGVLPLRQPRPVPAGECPERRLHIEADSPIIHLESWRNDDANLLMRAPVVLAVGSAVPPDGYGLLGELLHLLRGELGATRKVTDNQWLPRARQIGLTGRAVSPRLLISVGASGKFNHLIGARGAAFVLAINNDPSAPVFSGSDLGIVGDWREAVELLTKAIDHELSGAPA
jgi:electron transfer flavoprotein alpha subunit